MSKQISLRELPKTKRPRERLLTLGGENSSDQELLAIILNTGTRKQNALQLAQRMLKDVKTLKKLTQLSATQLMDYDGVGQALASRLLACFELSKRLQREHLSISPAILSSQDALNHVTEIRNQNREHLIVLYLNGRQELLKKELISIGGLNFNNLEPRDVFALAVTLPCAYFIMIHNHPSGDPTPSQEDLEVTERLIAAAELLGIGLIDHLIVSSTKIYSFKEKGLL